MNGLEAVKINGLEAAALNAQVSALPEFGNDFGA